MTPTEAQKRLPVDAYLRAARSAEMKTHGDGAVQAQAPTPRTFFDDVVEFSEKFQLPRCREQHHELTRDQLAFRIKFMLEELSEYLDAVGVIALKNDANSKTCDLEKLSVDVGYVPSTPDKAFDALIDLVYVILGTAHMHRFNFNEGWKRVHAANMSKVLAKDYPELNEKDWRKNSPMDIVKPKDWEAPSLKDLLHGA